MKHLFTTLLFFLSFSTYSQSIIYVTTTGAGNQSGSSWSNALSGNQLQNQLAFSSSGTQFWLAGGVYNPGVLRTATFQIPSGVQVYGGFSGFEYTLGSRNLTTPSSTTLTGEIGNPNITSDNVYHVVSFKDAAETTRLDGLVITGGNADDSTEPHNSGGGIYNEVTAATSNPYTSFTSSPTIINCLFVKNYAGNGGAFSNHANTGSQCNPLITNCIFRNNKASSGGGIYNYTHYSLCSPVLSNCKFTANEAIAGGAFLSSASFNGGENEPLFNACLFEDNKATSGGVFSISSSFAPSVNPTFSNCLFIGNQATTNGGIGTMSTFAYASANPTFINCTFANNTAASGKTLFSNRYQETFINIRFLNSIVETNDFAYNNGANRIAPTYNIMYSNIRGGFAGTGNIDADPLFVDAANGNYRLLRNSPSINTGDPASTTASVSATDIAGGSRIFSNRIDMGAYEFAPFADLRMAMSVSNRTPAVDQSVAYNVTITNDGPEPTANVTWQNQLPANMLFAGGTGVSTSANLVYGTIASLAPGEARTTTYQLQPSQPGHYINAAQITASDQPDPDSQPNSGTGDGQDDAAQVDLRTIPDNSAVYVSPNPNQVPLPPVASNPPPADPTRADLSLAMIVSTLTPKVGDVVTVTLRVDNAGGLTATGIAIKLTLPNGMSFVSGNGFSASGQSVTGSVNSIGVGASADLTALVRVDADNPASLTAEISASNQLDPDSQPNSGVADGQDDTATINLRINQ
ncbi:hypothetical protein BH09BAC4_BH09BAC4_40500 [soil metagenome]